MSPSSVYLDFHQPSLGGFSTLSPQEGALLSNMKMMMNMQQAKINHLSSKLGQSNCNSELQTTQDNQPSSSLSQFEVYFPREQFPEKLYHMLELADAQGFGPSSNAVSWLPSGQAFTVHDEKVFMEAIVPLFFKQTKVRSFARQLNLWGFKRLNTDSSCTYCHERFVRGSPEGLKFMVRTTCTNRKKPADLSPKVSEGQLQHRADDCTQVSNGSLSGVHVSSQSPIPSKSLKSRRVSMEPDVSPGVYPPSQYSVADPSFKRQVTIEDDDVPVGTIDQVGILALNESVPRDEFAEYIDHMIHLL